MMKLDRNCPAIEEVMRRVSYDPESGEFRYKISRGRRKKGDVAGYKDALGYIKIGFDSKWVLAHRLAWRLERGVWPNGEIDHINGNPSDNRILNLRECTRSQNVMNTRRGNGVCYRPERGRWQVIVKANGKSHWGGMFSDEKSAHAKAKELIQNLHGEFANLAPAPVQESLL